MRLYVIDRLTNQKQYLSLIANSRSELATQLNHINFYLNEKPNIVYSVNEVMAEKDTHYSVPGAIVGGLLGLIIGPEGIILGAAIGGAIGFSTDKNDEQKVATFNSSWAS